MALFVLSTYTCDGHLLLHALGAPVELQEESGRYGIGQVVEAIAGVYHHVVQELCKQNISAPIKFVGRKSRVKKKKKMYASLQLRF